MIEFLRFIFLGQFFILRIILGLVHESMSTLQMIRYILPAIISICQLPHVFANTLHVGSGYPFSSLTSAAAVVTPGDTILIHAGIYPGGVYLEDLQGTPTQWIYLHAAPSAEVIFEGGTNAWQLTDAAYLHIRGFIFQQQTGNGLNFDDGGSYDTPAHHVIFEDCIFRDINASGNNDLLKLSGLDSFEIRSCHFLNGAAGGSGIDMVGCHHGLIKNTRFENLGSNSIQAKGGTSNIRIEANFFKNGGARALNLGGSTGLQFFRPIDAAYEAADLKVYSNIIIGSEAAVAFVGSINCEVINNTIYLPTKWIMRILQETVDETRFPPCGNNTFRNNIIYIDNRVTVDVNIGPNTAPETFTFSNNLWYHSQDPGWPGPDLPAPDMNSIIGQDPLFVNVSNEDFDIQDTSPAIGLGLNASHPNSDFLGDEFLNPRSIGAHEGGMATSVLEDVIVNKNDFEVYPNPFSNELNVKIKEGLMRKILFKLTRSDGSVYMSGEHEISSGMPLSLYTKDWPSGIYFFEIQSGKHLSSFTIMRL